MKAVVGLGNFKGYDHTPHNVGYDVVNALAERLKLDWRDVKDRVQAAVLEDELVLLKPLSYMNVSGPHVRWALERWRVPLADLLVVCDDFAIPWGRLRFRRGGSSGGHNGLDSVIQAVGTQEFPRLRVGVGPVPEGMDPKAFVLKRQPPARLAELAGRAADGAEAAVREGVEKAMNLFNAAPEPPAKNG